MSQPQQPSGNLPTCMSSIELPEPFAAYCSLGSLNQNPANKHVPAPANRAHDWQKFGFVLIFVVFLRFCFL